MAVLNRCAIAVTARAAMREWTRPFRSREEQQQKEEERSLYLIPAYDDSASALELIREHAAAIFEAELELWCHDRALWPAPRDLVQFRDWFSLELFPLVEDLGRDPLISYAESRVFSERLSSLLPCTEPPGSPVG